MGGFQRHADNPLEAGAVVLDETSMLDTELAAAVLAAIPPHARLIFVGDVDQLPSVGAGAVLRDVIQSEQVPVVRLTQIFRQAKGSAISEAAQRINCGERPIGADGPGGEFYFFPRDSQEAAADTILELVTSRIPRQFGFNPVTEIQVLAPMYKGAAGTDALNQRLQAALNPVGLELRRGSGEKERIYRVGDKVMQLKNDYDKGVFNGDLGFVVSVNPEEKSLTVRFDGEPIAYAGNELNNLAHAYASTIHRSQGSEYPCVVIPILQAHFVMLSRNLVYTAVTRGKKLVVLVADPKAVRTAISQRRREDRRTGLVERLRCGPSTSTA
jgi:exodeoxyribonuclease V alpha subunit